MPDALYDIGIKLGMEASAFTLGMQQAIAAFTSLERAATSADTAASRFAPRLNTAYSNVEKSTLRVAAATDALNQSQTRLAMGGTTMAQHATAINAVNKAQDDLNTRQAAYNDILAQQTAATDAATAAHDRLGQAQRGLGMMAVGGAITAGGVMGFDWLKEAGQQAMDLQTVMARVSSGLTDAAGHHLTPQAQAQAMTALQHRAVDIGTQNQMSVTDVAGIMAAAVGAGITTAPLLETMAKPLANLGEVLKMTRGLNPDESAGIAAEFAHLFGAYGNQTFTETVGGKSQTVTDAQYLTDQLARALMVTRATPAEFLTQTTPIASILRQAMPDKTAADQMKVLTDSINLSVLMSQMGQGPRAGTEFARMVQQIMKAGPGTSTASAKAVDAIEKASSVKFVQNGAITDPVLLVKALADAAKNMTPQERTTEFTTAFQSVGARIAGLLSNPATQKRLGLVDQTLGPNGLGSSQSIQQTFNQTAQGQMNQATKNWQTFTTLLGQQLIPALSGVAVQLAKITLGMVQFADQHPGLLKVLATFAAIATVMAVIVGPFVILAGTIAVLGAGFGTIAAVGGAVIAFLTALGEGISLAAFAFLGLDIAMGPITLAILAIAAAVAAVVLVFTHWHQITQALGNLFGWLGDKLHGFLVLLGLIHDGPPKTTHQPTGYNGRERTHISASSSSSSDGTVGMAATLPPIKVPPTPPPPRAARPVQQHIGQVNIHIHPPAGTDEHKIAARTKDAIKQIGAGFAMDATYGSFGFTSNPTLRSGGW